MIALLLAAGPGGELQGQGASASTFTAVSGIAVDSVRGGYLRDAIVSVLGTKRFAVTDSLGRFHIDSVPAGSHALRLSHALLDTLGLSVTTQPAQLLRENATLFLLAIPSPATIVARKCLAAEVKLGGSILAGAVLDAETEMPSVDAEVIVAWTDVQVGKASIARTPQSRKGKVQADGSYLICGIPSDLATGVIAIRGSDSTAAVPVDFSRTVAVQSFLLPSPSAMTAGGEAASLTERMTISGRVIGPDGEPLYGARVAVDADDATTLSREDGWFNLSGVRAGTRLVSVRKLGLEPIETPIRVSRTAPEQPVIHLRNSVRVLETVRVTALRDLGLQRVGFSERKRVGSGYYFSPEQIERRNPLKLNYLLETAPMLRTGATQDGKRYITGRDNRCVRYFVDGWLQTEVRATELAYLPDSYISTAELGAVEVYSPMTAPVEFFAKSRSGDVCFVVVIWTKFKIGVH